MVASLLVNDAYWDVLVDESVNSVTCFTVSHVGADVPACRRCASVRVV